jgi:hypothetical protein
MSEISAPLFDFSGVPSLSSNDSYLRNGVPPGSFTLSGPGARAEAGHLPVRGDLAHIRLAGRYFVPHYAVPMPHAARENGATLRKAGKADAIPLCTISAGEAFDVLDISGGWAWGQLGEDGFVGYVALSELESPTPGQSS